LELTCIFYKFVNDQKFNTMQVRYLLFALLSLFIIVSCNKDDDFDDDPDVEPEMISGNQTTPITLENIFNNPNRIDYVISGNWNITAPVIIEAGVRISMQSNARIRVSGSGSLQCIGTESEPIFIEGQESSPGYWQYIAIESNSPNNRLEYCNVKDGGGSSLSSYPGMIVLRGNAQTAIINSNLSNSQRNGFFVGDNDSRLSEWGNNSVTSCQLYPISLRSTQLALMDEGTSFDENNGFNQIEVIGATINSPMSIPKVNGPYAFKGNTNIEAMVEIQPGTYIEMGPSARINITTSGSLNMTGTSTDRITITGEQEAKGYWDFIYFNGSNSPNNQFKYVDISYGGGSSLSCCGANIASNNSIFSMENSSVNNSQRWGIRLRSNSQFEDLGGNTFDGNELGDLDD